MNEKRYDLEEILSQYGSKKSTANNEPCRVADEPCTVANEPCTVTDEPIKEKNTKAPQKKRLSRRDVCDWFESLIASVAAIVFVIVFVARINQVYGISMEPTLTEGDKLIVMPLYSAPKYGDIVVLQAENLPNSMTAEMGEPIVKRIIGLPGDEIYIERESGEVYRNGERLEELYIAEKIAYDKIGNQQYPLKIADGQIFVMGDNRNHSTDSRVTTGKDVYYYVGCVDIGYIIGKATLRVYPFDNFGGLY